MALRAARLVFLAALVVLAAPLVARAQGSREPSFGPRPAWVVPVEPAAPGSSKDLAGGVEYLLLDDQIRLGDKGAEHWARRVRRIGNLQGIDTESQFDIDWDPVWQSLTIHRIVITRDGKEIDRLDPAAIEVVRREPNFEASMLDGTLSALVLIRDVRVGDVIEHEFTLTGSNPVFGGRWFGGFTAGWSVPVRRLGYRVTWPSSRRLTWRASGLGVDPVAFERDGMKQLSWLVQNIQPVDRDDDEPDWFDAGGAASLSEFTSWADVARWAVPLYDAPRPSGEMLELVGRLKAEGAAPEDQALAAIRFVQDEVRYLGLENGTSSHRPSLPDVVLERRFGDCKDKTLLLVTLLRALGLRAEPGLISTTLGAELTDALPSPGEFDHVIVRLQLGGATYWIDPTISAQRGRLASRHVPRYGKALIVAPETTGLTDVVPPEGDRPQTEVESRFVLSKAGGAATLAVKTTYRGRDADDTRASLAGESRQQTQRSYLDYYSRLYPSLEAARPLVIRDDETENVLVTEESYRIPEMWTPSEDGSRWTADFHAPEIENLLVEPDRTDRDAPLLIDHPQHVVQRTSIELPEDWDVEEADDELESEGAVFRRSIAKGERRVELSYEWQSLAEWIPAGEAARHAALVRQALDMTDFTLTAAGTGSPLATAGSEHGFAAMNWSALALAIMTAFAGAAAALALVLWSPAPPPAEPPDDIPGPRGLGGAGPLLFAVVVLLPVGLGVSLSRSVSPFALPTWNALTMPGSASYEPLAAPLMLLSLIGGVLAFVMSLSLAPLLVLRRRMFRPMFTGVVMGSLVVSAFRALAWRVVPDALPGAPHGALLAVLAAGALACALYVLRSRRVKATFVR